VARKIRKRRVPPQLRPYLFRKGRSKVRRRRVRAVKPRRAVRLKRRRRNPLQAPAVSHFIYARRGGKALHYDGVKFTSNGKPVYFRSRAQAEHTARELLRKFPVLRTYDVYVKDTGTKH